MKLSMELCKYRVSQKWEIITLIPNFEHAMCLLKHKIHNAEGMSKASWIFFWKELQVLMTWFQCKLKFPVVVARQQKRLLVNKQSISRKRLLHHLTWRKCPKNSQHHMRSLWILYSSKNVWDTMVCSKKCTEDLFLCKRL